MKLSACIVAAAILIFLPVSAMAAQSRIVLCGDPYPPYTLGTEHDPKAEGMVEAIFYDEYKK